MPLETDDALMRAWSAGDPSAGVVVTQRYGPLSYQLACMVGFGRHDAVEAVVAGFAAAGQRVLELGPAASDEPGRYGSADSERPSGGAGQAELPDLRRWLFAVLSRCLRDQRRERSRHDPTPVMLPLGKELEPGLRSLPWPVSQTELVRMTWCAVQQLGPGQRDLVGLHAPVGLDVAALSQIAGRSTASVSVELESALDQIRHVLTTLLVARIAGSPPCEGLHQAVTYWDGRFTSEYTRKVGQHVAGCETCRNRGVRLRAELAQVPLALPKFRVPAELTDRLHAVLTASQHGSGTGLAGWQWRSDGYPADVILAATPAGLGHDLERDPAPDLGQDLDDNGGSRVPDPNEAPARSALDGRLERPVPPANREPSAPPIAATTAASRIAGATAVNRADTSAAGTGLAGTSPAGIGRVSRNAGRPGMPGGGASGLSGDGRAGGRGVAVVGLAVLAVGSVWLLGSQRQVNGTSSAPRVGSDTSRVGSPTLTRPAGLTSPAPSSQGPPTGTTGAAASAAPSGSSAPDVSGAVPGADPAPVEVSSEPETVYTSSECGRVTSQIVVTSAASPLGGRLEWPGGSAALRIRSDRLVGVAGPFMSPGITRLTVTINDADRGRRVATVTLRVLFCGS